MKKIDRQKVFEYLVVGELGLSMLIAMGVWIVVLKVFLEPQTDPPPVGFELAVLVVLALFVATISAIIAWVALFLVMGTTTMKLLGLARSSLDTKKLDQELNHSWMNDYQTAGYRTAYLIYDSSSIRFRSIVKPVTFGIVATAQCHSGNSQRHRAPNARCSCGFYSARLPSGTVTMRGGEVLLRCFYTGTVIPGTKGLRAERQHVTSVLIPAKCSVHTRCKSEATRFTLGSASNTEPRGRTWYYLVPCCDEHLDDDQPSFSEVDLRNQLQIDVEWIR